MGELLCLVAVVALVGFGAFLHRCLADTPTEREQALAAKIDALTTANYLGGEYFRAQSEMRDEMSRASSRGSSASGRATVGRAWVVDGEFHE